MYEGITDYLEMMRLAGVSEVRKTANVTRAADVSPPVKETQRVVDASPPVQENTHPIPVPLPNAPKDEQLLYLANDVAQCTRCKDLAGSRTQIVFGTGNPDSPLVFLGEAPGVDEDKQGEPFVGRSGQLLTDIITRGMQLRREDVYICNILRCRPPGNRNPMPDEAAHCRPFLDRTLEIIQPKFICCLGAIAAKNLLASEKTIGALRGKVWEYKGIRVVCTYHPAYLLRNPAAKKDAWDDIKLLMREMEM
jgi:DNA polymerase